MEIVIQSQRMLFSLTDGLLERSGNDEKAGTQEHREIAWSLHQRRTRVCCHGVHATRYMNLLHLIN